MAQPSSCVCAGALGALGAAKKCAFLCMPIVCVCVHSQPEHATNGLHRHTRLDTLCFESCVRAVAWYAVVQQHVKRHALGLSSC